MSSLFLLAPIFPPDGTSNTLSKHWLKHLKVDGKTQGIFDMNTKGDISPTP
ncbi:hypothetical protein Spla01_00134 [Streptomyces platensis]|uniref:Uncharacterized protein n=1 Tax=Streptomyces platensis TaxID=58346 RepID=A0ABX3Y6T8_STRPT|nr:hypothetical protein [Streptomyces platensis]OSY48314.1 hypothetical protein BG653_00191 [Streptomyces platensis]